MNILISGIHGFVGSNFIRALKDKHTLYGLDIVSPAKEGVVTTFSWQDFEPTSFPFQTLPQFDAIIHLAGKAHDTKNQSAAQSYFDINTGLTQKIFDFFLESSAKKFIFFSSVKAAADSVVGDVLTEDVIPTPVGPYGESKIKAEEYIKNHFILTEQRFMKLTAALEQEQEANQKRLHDLAVMQSRADAQESEVRTFIKEIRRYAAIEELDESVLNRLISKILIGEIKKVDGQKVQEVRIGYNFVGEIPEIAA